MERSALPKPRHRSQRHLHARRGDAARGYTPL